MKILRRITIIVGILSLLYLAGCVILPHTEYSYRMWVNASGKLLTAMVLPLLLLIMGGIWLWKRNGLHMAVKIIWYVISTAAYLYWGFWVFLFLLFTTQEEKQLTRHLLVANESEFLGAARYEYYRPAAFFFREPGDLTDEVKKEYLYEKYGDFVDEFSMLDVQVYRSGMALEDDFTEFVTTYLAEQGIVDHRIERDFYISENFQGGHGWLYLELEDEEDIIDLADTIRGLIAFIMEKTDFYEKHRGMICFYYGEGDDRITGNVPFGKLSEWDQMEPDYYQDAELVAERIREEYEAGIRFQERMEADRKRYEETAQNVGPASDGEAEDGEGESSGTEADGSLLERAAGIIYDEVLADQGYSYELCYNAKGNLYLDLGERPAGEPGDKSDSGYYQFSLVYDRSSANGEYELFVLYKEHYSEDVDGNKTQDGSVILDIYAVKTATGKVIASGRTAWSDLGTQEYREATGE